MNSIDPIMNYQLEDINSYYDCKNFEHQDQPSNISYSQDLKKERESDKFQNKTEILYFMY